MTIYAVAQAAGVSIATVSRVLTRPDMVARDTRERVLSAVAQLDYMPAGSARSLAVRHNEAHGLVLPELVGPYYSELLMGYEAAAAAVGRSVILMLTRGKRDAVLAVRQLAAKVDGLVVFGSADIPEQVLLSLARTIPVILIAADPAAGIEVATTENRASAMLLTRHLIEHGRRKLLFVGDPGSARDIRDRYAGFLDAHRDASRPASEALAVPFVEAEGAAVADALADGRIEADALVCANDELALAVIQRLKIRGVAVPDEVAVVGYDDVMAARYVEPGLTTVRQPVREMGSLVASRLHERISGAPVRTEVTVLATELVIRQSCGCTAATGMATHSAPIA